jgi:hypothetical protein
MRRFFKWLFKKEYAEALSLVEQARKLGDKYVAYQTFNVTESPFLFAMSEISEMPEVRFWLLERQRQADQLVKYSTDGNRDHNIGRSMLIDELLGDLKKFKVSYLELLEIEKRRKVNA